MEVTRIINGIPAQSYQIEWVDANQEKLINGAFVKDWVLAPKYSGNYVLPKWNGTDYYESATPEQIAEANKVPVPEKVSAIQFFAQLEFIGITQQTIFETIEYLFTQGVLTEQQKIIALISVRKAIYFERNHAFINLIASAFQKTETDIDNIFINASKII